MNSANQSRLLKRSKSRPRLGAALAAPANSRSALIIRINSPLACSSAEQTRRIGARLDELGEPVEALEAQQIPAAAGRRPGRARQQPQRLDHQDQLAARLLIRRADPPNRRAS